MRLKVLHGKSLNSSCFHSFFGFPNFFESLEGSPQIFWHCETKTVDRIVIPYYPKAFRYQNISETKGSPDEIFRYCETKRINRIGIPLLSKTFWYQNISETQNGSPMIFFGDVRQKNRQSCDTPVIQKNFDVRTILKNRRVRPRCFPAIWGKKTSTEKSDTPFLPINFFSTRTFLKDESVP